MLGTPQQAMQYSTSPFQQATLSGTQPVRAGLDQMYIFSSGAEGPFQPAISTQTSGLPQADSSQVEGHQQPNANRSDSAWNLVAFGSVSSRRSYSDTCSPARRPRPDRGAPVISHVFGCKCSTTKPFPCIWPSANRSTPPGPSRATVSSHMLLLAGDAQMSGHEQEDPAPDLAQLESYPPSVSFQRPGSQQMSYFPAFTIPVGGMTQTSGHQEEDPALTAALQLSRASRNEAHRRITRASRFAFDAGGSHPPDKYQEALEQASLD